MRKLLLFFLIAMNLFPNTNDIKLESPILDYNVKEIEYHGDGVRLWNQTKTTVLLAAGMMTTLFVIPELIGAVPKDNEQDGLNNYRENIKIGPEWDSGIFFFNYMAHPYVGSCYYIAARKSGFSPVKSFSYSFLMSLVFWEYGIEATVLVPSIQDIIITPGVGSLLGEYLYGVEKKILASDGKILDSRFWGKTALLLIDPIGSAANMMGYKDKEVQGYWTVLNDGKKDVLAYGIRGEF